MEGRISATLSLYSVKPIWPAIWLSPTTLEVPFHANEAVRETSAYRPSETPGWLQMRCDARSQNFYSGPPLPRLETTSRHVATCWPNPVRLTEHY